MLTGENQFGIRQALRAVAADFVAAHGEHGVERTDGETLDLASLPSLLQGGSLFAPNRLVILSNPAKNKVLWECLAEQTVPDSTTLIVVEPAPDKRTKTYKSLKDSADFREFTTPSDVELIKWLQSVAAEYAASISPKDAQYLIERAGRDQWRLAGEVQKLASLDPAITRQTIDQLVEPEPQGSAFALLDAALAGDARQVIFLVDQLKTQEDPYKLFGLIASQVHTLAVVASGPANPDQIAKEAGLHPFVVRKSMGLAKKLGKERIASIAADVALCDVQLKSTGADPWDLVRLCLQKIATRHN